MRPPSSIIIATHEKEHVMKFHATILQAGKTATGIEVRLTS